MNRDQAKGHMRSVKGQVKEAAGKAAGSERLRTEGKAEKAAGRLQDGVGNVKRTAKKAIDGS